MHVHYLQYELFKRSLRRNMFFEDYFTLFTYKKIRHSSNALIEIVFESIEWRDVYLEIRNKTTRKLYSWFYNHSHHCKSRAKCQIFFQATVLGHSYVKMASIKRMSIVAKWIKAKKRQNVNLKTTKFRYKIFDKTKLFFNLISSVMIVLISCFIIVKSLGKHTKY